MNPDLLEKIRRIKEAYRGSNALAPGLSPEAVGAGGEWEELSGRYEPNMEPIGDEDPDYWRYMELRKQKEQAPWNAEKALMMQEALRQIAEGDRLLKEEL